MFSFMTAIQSKIQNIMRRVAARAPGQPLADPENGITSSATETSPSTILSPPNLEHFVPGLHSSNIILAWMRQRHNALAQRLRSRVAFFAGIRRNIGEHQCPLQTKLANILRTLANLLPGTRQAEAHIGDLENGAIARLAHRWIPPSFKWMLAATIMILIAAVSQKFATTYMARLPPAALIQTLFDIARRISLARPLFLPLL